MLPFQHGNFYCWDDIFTINLFHHRTPILIIKHLYIKPIGPGELWVQPYMCRFQIHMFQGLAFLKIITCPTSRILKLFNLLEIKKKNLLKSTCRTSSFTCPGTSGSGKQRALMFVAIWNISCKAVIRWIPQDLIHDKYSPCHGQFIFGILKAYKRY